MSTSGLDESLFGMLTNPSRLPELLTLLRERYGQSPAAQAALLRDSFGNPFRPARVCQDRLNAEEAAKRGDSWLWAGWLAWNDGTIPRLAEAAYQERGEVCGRCGGTGNGRRFPNDVDRGNEGCPGCGGTGRTQGGLLDPQRLAVLRDALLEAGCPQDSLLVWHLPDGEGRSWEVCPQCLGACRVGRNTGPDPKGEWPCGTCDGGGRVPAGPACPECGGSGDLDSNNRGDPIGYGPCRTCKGSGHLPAVFVRGDWAIDLLLGKE